jgi:hypothetical protein
MRFGKWQGMPLWLSLSTALGLSLGLVSSAQADGLIFQHTIPREVLAYDFTTGRPYYAPPIPFGHYAKDYLAYGAVNCVTCRLRGLMGGGNCFLHSGHGEGQGHGQSDDGAALEYSGAYGAIGAGGAGFATTLPLSTAQSPVQASGQWICGQAGCQVGGRHSHLGTAGLCGDPGCGLGVGHSHGAGTGCSLCGGIGCASCLGGHKLGLGGLGSGIHGKIASIAGVLHKPKMSWFLGAGGPVPLTPGYVPYIVTTRSPRDFLSFAPMNPNAP